MVRSAFIAVSVRKYITSSAEGRKPKQIFEASCYCPLNLCTLTAPTTSLRFTAVRTLTPSSASLDAPRISFRGDRSPPARRLSHGAWRTATQGVGLAVLLV
jgi:hypothetical protein